MDNLINLRDLLDHEILDLHSAEKQIIEGLPAMIDNASDPQLKSALSEHLEETRNHKMRLEQIQQLLKSGDSTQVEEKENFFSKLFGGVGEHKCRGTEGLIKEGENMMGENMSSEVRDAAIIACAQKIEHYEISGYGTARAFAQQLGLTEVAGLLEQTLDEEYETDERLTELAVGKVNLDAENAVDTDDVDDYDDNNNLSRNTSRESSSIQTSAGQTMNESFSTDLGTNRTL